MGKVIYVGRRGDLFGNMSNLQHALKLVGINLEIKL